MTENRFVMVSEWMKNGNIDDFLIKNPSADRLELVSISCRLYSRLSLTLHDRYSLEIPQKG